MSTTKPLTDKYVQLSGEDGNSFFIIGRVNSALKEYDREHGTNHKKEFTSRINTCGSQEELIQLISTYVDIG